MRALDAILTIVIILTIHNTSRNIIRKETLKGSRYMQKELLSVRNIILMACCTLCVVAVAIAISPIVIRLYEYHRPWTAGRIFEKYSQIVYIAGNLPPSQRSMENLMPKIHKSGSATIKQGVILSEKLPTSMTISHLNEKEISINVIGINMEECFEFMKSLRKYRGAKINQVKMNGEILPDFNEKSVDELIYLCINAKTILNTGLIILIQVDATLE